MENMVALLRWVMHPGRGLKITYEQPIGGMVVDLSVDGGRTYRRVVLCEAELEYRRQVPLDLAHAMFDLDKEQSWAPAL